MTPERYREVTDLFQKVVGLRGEARSSLLDRACAGDPGLRDEVAAMLASDADPRYALEPAPDPLRETVGRYRVERLIGEGGMGIVFEGVDVELGRKVAVKILRKGLASRPEFLRRFLEEARIGGRLEHPGIVPVYELGSDETSGRYFTMRLIDGRTLAELLADRAEGKSRDLHRFLSIFERVCQTMAYAHTRGIIHRDLKPANVLVGAFGEVQVLDWGLARSLRDHGGDADTAGPARAPATGVDRPSMTRAGSVLGTPAYMSPEQARGDLDQVDERSDVFALGGILCEILTGAPPYAGGTESSLRAAERGELDPALERLDACRADREIVDLALRCLARERSDRPTSAEPLAESVRDYLSAVEERAQRSKIEAETARVQIAQERRARRLTLALAAAVLGILVVLGGGWAWVRAQREQRRQRTAELVTEALQEAVLLQGKAQVAGAEAVAPRLEALAAARRAEALIDTEEVEPGLAARVRRLTGELEHDTDAAQRAAAARRWERSLRVALARIPWSLDENLISGGENLGRILEEQCRSYRRVFAEHDLDIETLEVDAAAKRIMGTHIVQPLLESIDGWARARRRLGYDESGTGHLVAIAQAVDRDATRRELRRMGARDPVDQDEVVDYVRSLDLRALSPYAVDIAGMLLKRTGDGEARIDFYREAIRHFPNRRALHIHLGLLYRADHPARARHHMSVALALDPSSHGVKHQLGAILQKMGRWEESLEVFQALSQSRPDHAAWRHRVALALSKLDRRSEALTEWDATIRLAPGDARAWLNRGLVRIRMGERRGAITDFEQSFSLQPSATAMISAAMAHRELGEEEEALRCLRAAAPTASSAADHLYLARLLHDVGDDEEIVEHLRAAARQAPRSLSVQLEVAKRFRDIEDDDASLQAAIRAVELAPADLPARRFLARRALVLDRPDLAEDSLLALLRLDPGDDAARRKLADLLASRRDWIAAMAVLREAVRRRPESAQARHDLALCCRRLGRETAAVEHLRRAVELAPEEAGHRAELAWSLLSAAEPSSGTVEEALGHARALHLREPADGRYRAILGVAECRLGRWEEGLANLRTGLETISADRAGFLYWAAMGHARLGDVTAARAAYDEAGRLRDDDEGPGVVRLRREAAKLVSDGARGR